MTLGDRGPSPSELVARVFSSLREVRALSEESAHRLGDLMTHFSRFAERGLSIERGADVTGSVAEEFVRARTSSGTHPAGATMHVRRAALRLLFAEGRRLGLVSHDPTLDLELPPRSNLRTRPLTDEEVALCRMYSVRTPSATRQPAAWALAEATCRSSEMSILRVADVDLEHGRVWIPGGTKTVARRGVLSGWGRIQIERRVRALSGEPDRYLVCPAARQGRSGTASSSIAISSVLRRAGLHREPDVRPGSVVAWAGATALAGGASINEVALLLGVRSLDRAAALIGFEWGSRS
jgi:integrase